MADYKVKAEGLNEALSTFFAIAPPHLKPIEVQEALPQPEDLDHWHRCWWFYANDYGDSCWVLTDAHSVVSGGATHWLAANHIANPLDD
jgi:flavin-dependent dehydrogenase